MKINPQIENEINRCVQSLRRGEFIIFPDETGWSIGCDPMNDVLVKKILESDLYCEHVLLVDESGRLNKFVRNIPDPLWDLVEFSTRPMNIILADVVNIPKQILNNSGETTFRVAKDTFANILAHKFGKPVFAAQLREQTKPDTNESGILNTPAYVVNLRLGAKINPESLVILRLSSGGRIEFIRK